MAEQFFTHHPDSTGPMLQLAIDTLQARHTNAPFVGGFIAERGLPLWNSYRSLPNPQGAHVLRVPVRAANKRDITGLIEVTFQHKRPHYRWVARGSDPPGISARGLETIFWGYEQQVFGKTHTDEGAPITIKIKGDTTGGRQISVEEDGRYCYRICVREYCGPVECKGGGGTGDFPSPEPPPPSPPDPYNPSPSPFPPGGGGGGSPSPEDEDNTDPDCNGIAGGGHSLVPIEDQDPSNPQPLSSNPHNPSNPSTPSCEEDEETAEILFDSSFENTKAECVYNKLNDLSTGFAEAIQNFDGEFPVSHLKWTMDDLGASDAGRATAPNSNPTTPNSPDYVITITLNNSTTSRAGVNYRPNLMTATTLAHEVIHAEMYRKLMSLPQKPNFDGFTRQEIVNLLSNGDYPGIYDYYRTFKTNWSHQQMANHYRETIADMLQDYDNHSRNHDFYMDLAWEGLRYPDIYIWNSKSGAEKDRIDAVIDNYIVDYQYENCQE